MTEQNKTYKVYKIDSGHFLKMPLDDKKLEWFKTKYMYYQDNDLVIFNFDHNLAKPHLLRLLKLKGYFDTTNYKIIWILFFFLIIFAGFYYFGWKSTASKTEQLQQTVINHINKLDTKIESIKNPETSKMNDLLNKQK